MDRLIFISLIFGVMSFLIYFARTRFSIPDILENQRQELFNLAGLVNGLNNSIDINEGDKN
ncbi:MAG: hypothetical protein JW716_00155 [Candidatus Aenigmarchaeota archaeon]|nr:hypothetical protein [Candidatus Aenigmarchaeota archaeon]